MSIEWVSLILGGNKLNTVGPAKLRSVITMGMGGASAPLQWTRGSEGASKSFLNGSGMKPRRNKIVVHIFTSKSGCWCDLV